MAYILTYNNIYTFEFKHEDELEVAASRAVSTLDGEKYFALLLWRQPEGKTFERTDAKKDCQYYLQIAGPYQDRYIVEVRRAESERDAQYAVGRQAQEDSPVASLVNFEFDGVKTRVHETELLTQEQVVHLFLHYLESQETKPGFALRQIRLP